MSTLTIELDGTLAGDLERLAMQANTTVADLATSALKSVVTQRDKDARAREKALGYLNKGFRRGDGKPLTHDEIYDRGSLH